MNHRLLYPVPVLFLLSCTGAEKAPEVPPTPPAPAGPTADDARAFVKEVDGKLREVWVASESANWTYETDITDAHEAASAQAEEASMAYLSEVIPRAAAFRDVQGLDPDTTRQLHLLKQSATLPAPSDPAKRKELAEIATKMGGMYGKGKHCTGEGTAQVCQDLGQLEEILATNRDPAAQLAAWKGWHDQATPMRPLYQRFVELGNEGARDIGYANMGEIWRSNYDMTPAELETEVDRLWKQVQPLYEQLHCHVRAELNERYGDSVVPKTGPIPAHLTGNMWAQSWEGLYPWLEPFPDEADLDVSAKLKTWDHLKMVKTAEGFFTSMGLDPMPQTFWERSMFVKPEGKEVVCHASAWDVTMSDDQRIKMCIKTTMDDLVTIHHELGHNYYNHYYTKLPTLYQGSAHDGFHEAIGDAIALSITPGYLQQVGLLDAVSTTEQGVVNQQMNVALQKVAFLPFGRMIDQWRWDVFSGEIPPDQYNAGWWKLREKYQGVSSPVERTEASFDPGAKYHIPGNTPYIRYFLAHILQFQLHEAMCKAAGHTGPLHTCSVYGSKEAGAKLQAMLAMGASKPWPDALEAIAGTRQMDAGALLEYFAPLQKHLEEQNKGRQCGW